MKGRAGVQKLGRRLALDGSVRRGGKFGKPRQAVKGVSSFCGWAMGLSHSRRATEAQRPGMGSQLRTRMEGSPMAVSIAL